MALLLEDQVVAGPASELRLTASTGSLPVARSYTRAEGLRLGLDARGAEELVFAVNEALTNAIRHGAPDGGGLIHLATRRAAGAVVVAVRDWGVFGRRDNVVPPFCESGRGFALMRSFVDDVKVRLDGGCTTVVLSKSCG